MRRGWKKREEKRGRCKGEIGKDKTDKAKEKKIPEVSDGPDDGEKDGTAA